MYVCVCMHLCIDRGGFLGRELEDPRDYFLADDEVVAVHGVLEGREPADHLEDQHAQRPVVCACVGVCVCVCDAECVSCVYYVCVMRRNKED